MSARKRVPLQGACCRTFADARPEFPRAASCEAPRQGQTLVGLLPSHVQDQRVVCDLVAMLGRDATLQGFDVVALELDDLAGFDVHHVVMVLATIELVNGVATL